MMSSATKVKGQGVGSAYIEQVNLVREGLGDKFEVFENAHMKADITHYHTINPGYYLGRKSKTKKGCPACKRYGGTAFALFEIAEKDRKFFFKEGQCYICYLSHLWVCMGVTAQAEEVSPGAKIHCHNNFCFQAVGKYRTCFLGSRAQFN